VKRPDVMQPFAAMKALRRIAPVLVAGLVVLPSVALAEGMPQLDFTTPLTISQVVWGTIIFVVLYILLSRTGLPMVESVLEERAAKISKDLDEARAAKAMADAGMMEADQATVKARAESQSAINAALDEAKKAAAAQAEVLNARLEQQLHDSEAQIGQARSAAMSALRQVATETAATVVTRLTGTAPDAGRLDGAIGSALAARGVG
jgi:F-type H+-transporting ATPase subunit b